MTRIDPADIAVLQSLRDAMMACNSAHTEDFALQVGGAFGEVHDTFIRAATKLLGATGAKRLMGLTLENGSDIEHCLNQLYPPHKCYVAMIDAPGRDTRAVCVFDDVEEANDWAIPDSGGVRWIQPVDYIPAKTAELPKEIEAVLEMIASDMSRMFSDLGYTTNGLDVDGSDILAALPAFLGAALAHARFAE